MASRGDGGAAAIEAVDLTKTYGKDVRALDGLTFRATAGTVFALLGPNGAGKSTTIKILTTLSTPDSGRASVAGIDVPRRPRTGAPHDRRRRPAGRASTATRRGARTSSCRARSTTVTGRRLKRRVDDLLERFDPHRRGRPHRQATPAACSASSTSRSACCTSRPCSSSTSRRPASIPRRAPRCAPGSSRPTSSPTRRADWLAASDAHDLERVFLVAPSSTRERLRSTVRPAGLGLRGVDHGRHGHARPGERPRAGARRPHPRRRRRPGLRRARRLDRRPGRHRRGVTRTASSSAPPSCALCRPTRERGRRGPGPGGGAGGRRPPRPARPREARPPAGPAA